MNVLSLMQDAGIKNKAAFARKSGITPSELSDLIRGSSNWPKLPKLIGIAKAFGCSVDDLIRGKDPDYDAIVMAQAVKRSNAWNKAESSDLVRQVADEFRQGDEFTPDAKRLARWFDELPVERSQSILLALGVPDAERLTPDTSGDELVVARDIVKRRAEKRRHKRKQER